MAAYRCANTDRLSHLPSEINEKILNLLPYRDAIRTSILSSDWRYKWISMTDLNFGGVPWGDEYKHARYINKCLLRHQGPIRKFSVRAHTSTVGRRIKQWLKLVSKHDIEEVKVVFEYRSVIFPSRLLNPKKLTHLELSGCLFDVPLSFEGFMNLKVLNLSYIKVKDKTSIESLISKSPLLESVSLKDFWSRDYSRVHYSRVSNITICAPKVKYLSLREFKSICLQNSPVLGHLRFHSYMYNCDLIKTFGDAPNLFNCNKLTHLDLCGAMLTIPPTFGGFMNLRSLKLSVREVDTSSIESLISRSPLLESIILNSRDSNIPITISAPKIKYLSLRGDLKNIGLEKSLVLVDMRLYLDGDSRDYCGLIKILGAAPNLEKLAVRLGWPLFENVHSHSLPNEADPDFCQKEYLVEHCFMKLKVVELGSLLCKAAEIEFVKFILSNSPFLEKMTIGTRVRNQGIRTHMLEKLQALPRASTQVAVTFTEKFDGDQTVGSLESSR